MGLSPALGVLIVLTFKRINKYALFFALAIYNPFTLIPIYIASLRIGDVLFGSEPIVAFNIQFFNQVAHFTRRFLVGNVFIALFLSILGYVVVYRIMETHRKRA